MKIYHYAEDTAELIGARDARVWPGREKLSDNDRVKFQIPAFSTPLKPPTTGANQIAIFVDGSWHITKDHRGEEWYSDEGATRTVTALGDPALQTPPLVAKRPPAPPPTADDVRAEAARRMQVIVGARDAGHLEIIIANATREAVRLLRIGAQNWSEAQSARAAELETLDAIIDRIRAKSNAMEINPPADYVDDRHWLQTQ